MLDERLETYLASPSTVEGTDGVGVVTLPREIDFVPEVRRILRQRFPDLAIDDLTLLHRVLPRELQLPSDGNINAVSMIVSDDSSPELTRLYHSLIRHLAENHFGADLVFEARPQLRFHFPVRCPDVYRRRDDVLACQHSDVLLGDYFEQRNCWLAVDRCHGTSALQVASLSESVSALRDFANEHELDLAGFHRSRRTFFETIARDDVFHERIRTMCRPQNLSAGELLVFDPRCLHGTAENVEDVTRISIDFRVLRVDDYEKVLEERRRDPRLGVLLFEDEPLTKGGYYDRLTASELRLAG